MQMQPGFAIPVHDPMQAPLHSMMFEAGMMPVVIPTGSPIVSMDRMDVESVNFDMGHMDVEGVTSIASLASMESTGSVSKYLNF